MRLTEKVRLKEKMRQIPAVRHSIGWAQTQLAEIENEVARARRQASFLGGGQGATVVLRAPLGGTVMALGVRVGAAVEPTSDALATIGDAAALRIVADVFERDLAFVQVGASVQVRLGALNEPLEGRVEHVGTLVDRTMRRAPVYISLAHAPDGVLRPGMLARVDIQAQSSEGLSVPTSAVLIKDRGNYVVYVEVDDLQFVARPVEIGPTHQGRVRILGGLEAGQRVVTRGGLLLDNSAEQLL